jgi:hypothetical protein
MWEKLPLPTSASADTNSYLIGNFRKGRKALSLWLSILMLEPYWNTDYAYNHSHRHQFEYLNLKNLSDQLAFIHDSQLQIHSGNIAADIELIQQCRVQSKRLPVLNLDSNPYDVDSYVSKLNQYLDPAQYFVFHSDIRTSQSTLPNVAPWPSWLLYQHFLPNDQLDKPKTKRISFLSGIPRSHRILLYKNIKNLVTDQDVVVINSFQAHSLYSQNQAPNDIPWANRQEYFDTVQTEYNANNQANNNHLAYQACVNITGETLGTGNQVLPSEKTWKAYKSRCLVVNYGVADMPHWLQSVGIEIWKSFDLAVKCEDKIKNIKELFNSSDIFEQYDQCHDMIEHNFHTVMSKNFASMLAYPAKEKISCLLK